MYKVIVKTEWNNAGNGLGNNKKIKSEKYCHHVVIMLISISIKMLIIKHNNLKWL